ncbi:MAG TPA: carboxymuconolactone decarboxylase family protein [Vicinamibacteria bacterium]|jgi:alkyl hydroperoxide reductase subunit D
MSALEAVRETLPEAARDIRLNLQSVLEGGSLTPAQQWGVAAACAIASRNPVLRDALVGEARERGGDALAEDAKAAAVLMAMNNVYYRFRHIVGKPGYAQRPARLRMQRIAQPLTTKADFELFCLAVSAINGCEACVRAHEHTVLESGLTEEQVHDAVRIAAVVHAAAVALES